ncbi:hypothetical protein BC629DRAFT_704718 [Irpex lacteus]|nr:hypothetical protein BC629DRAFT_704718 [Irpex lacteus]
MSSSDQRTEGALLETSISSSSIPQGKEDDDAVISMLEISSFNENAHIGRHSSDVESDKPSRLPTAPFSEKAANVQGHHIVTNNPPIVEPALGFERVQIQEDHPSESVQAAEHVRETSDSTVHAEEHTVSTRLQESAIFAPSQQKDDLEASVACARVPDSARTPQIVVTPVNNEDNSPALPTSLSDQFPDQEIVPISSPPPSQASLVSKVKYRRTCLPRVSLPLPYQWDQCPNITLPPRRMYAA